jgi:hypothetical protein
MKNKRGEIDVKGLAVFIVFGWRWWLFSLDRQSFPHSILRDAIKVERVSPSSRHGFTRANRPVNPDGKRNDTDRQKVEGLCSHILLMTTHLISDRERIYLLMLLFTSHETAMTHNMSPPPPPCIKKKRMTDDNDDDVSSHFFLVFFMFSSSGFILFLS